MLPAVLLALSLAVQDPTPAERLLAIVRHHGDHTDDAIFEELGRLGDRDAFEALKRATRRVSTPWSMQRVYEAFRHLEQPPELRRDTIGFLARTAREGEALHRVGAVRGLRAIGGPAVSELRKVAEKSDVTECRQLAVGGLLELLAISRQPEDLALLLATYRYPTSGPRAACVRALRRFDSPVCLELLARALVEPGLDRQMATMVVDALEKAPGAAAEAVLVRALASELPAVQLAAIETLAERGATSHVRELEQLERSAEPAVARAAFVALAAVRPDDARWLRDMLRAARSSDAGRRAAAATVLGRSVQLRARETLYELTRDTDAAVRAAALEAVTGVRTRASVPVLIEALAREEGWLRGVARAGLVRLTGLDHGLSAARWRAWWDSEGADFELPSYAEALAAHLERERARSGRTTRSTTFFGIDIESSAVCFVLDVSSSMQRESRPGATRLALVQRELAGALERYEDGRLFNLVFFSGGVRAWREELVTMDADVRARALRYVARQHAEGETALYDALIAGLEDPRVDTLVVLSDGEPTAGRVREPRTIADDILRRAERRGAKIHTISVERASELLERLAAATGGEHHVVR